MLDKEKWERLSGPLYEEEMTLWIKTQESGCLTEEEQRRLTYLRKILHRLFIRFTKHSGVTEEFF
jgi:hypothetical protein